MLSLLMRLRRDKTEFAVRRLLSALPSGARR